MPNILQQKANGLSIRAIVRHSNYSRSTIRGWIFRRIACTEHRESPFFSMALVA
ncbi:helix-turn-helix domain-containing protein [Algoriphagus litoralis]|uniref:helix-turn-helix domain-containing protein n=1 Tax=Algoriphagus litoralis TaxID=2202829 RepID=UPI000DB96675